MMHKIKKAAAQVTTKTTPESAEYAEYVVKLTNLSTYLKASSAALQESEATWKGVCDKQKAYAEAFANKYPDKDQVRDFSRTSAKKSSELVKEFVLKKDGKQANYHTLDALVQDYLLEIVAIQEQYKDVTNLNTEVQMYAKKVGDLSKAKKVDEAKTSRNMEKLDEAKENYEKKLDTIVDEMKAVYAKRGVALKATYVAYWSSQLRAFDLLSDALQETREFVSESVDPLSNMDLKKITEAELDEFIKNNTMGVKASPPTSPIEDKPTDPVVPEATVA